MAGLYFVGASIHSGAGMPGVLMTAKVLERVLPPAPNGRPPLGGSAPSEAQTVAAVEQ